MPLTIQPAAITPAPITVTPPAITPAPITISDAQMISALTADGYSVALNLTPAQKLQKYMNSLAANGNTKRVLTGHHAEIWSGDTEAAIMSNITPLQATTGKLPAILGLVLNFVSNSGAPDNATMQTVAQDWWAKGGIVHLSVYSQDPSSGTSVNPKGQASAANFANVVTPGTAANKAWQAQCAQYVAALQAIVKANPLKAIILRMFLEINGNWNWYGGQNLAQTVLLQQQTYGYLMNGTGLANNVLIEYNNNIAVGNYASFPGAAYASLASTDPYDVDSKLIADLNTGGLYATLVATGVPIGFAECGQAPAGTNPAAGSVDLSGILAPLKGGQLNQVVYFLHWCGTMSMYHQLNASTLLNDPVMVNLSDLPPL